MTREEQILDFMKKLEISREEAEQLLEDDENDFIGEDGEKMSQKAKENRRYEKSDEPKVKKPRERKVDTEKAEILEFAKKGLTLMMNSGNIIVENETKLHFNYNGTDYTLNLVKHRPPKN